MGAGALEKVISVAGCNVNNQRVGYSSRGPSIANMYQTKPDIAAYTHFVGSEVFGAGIPDAGTSAAAPIVAGVIAAVRTKVGPSAALAPVVRNSASTPSGYSSGWNTDYGYGIINAWAAAVGATVQSCNNDPGRIAQALQDLGFDAGNTAKNMRQWWDPDGARVEDVAVAITATFKLKPADLPTVLQAGGYPPDQVREELLLPSDFRLAPMPSGRRQGLLGRMAAPLPITPGTQSPPFTVFHRTPPRPTSIRRSRLHGRTACPTWSASRWVARPTCSASDTPTVRHS